MSEEESFREASFKEASLEVLHLGADLLAVVSALPRTYSPHRSSLHTKALDSVVDSYRLSSSSRTILRSYPAVFQVAVLAPSQPEPSSLTDVEVAWFMAAPRETPPPFDVLEMACSLWCPSLSGSPHHRFVSAYDTASRLVRLSALRASSAIAARTVDSQPRPWLLMLHR